MAQAQYRTLSKRVLDRVSVNGKDAIFWDRDLAGFGVRVYPSGKNVFVVQTRAFGRSKRMTLGTYPKLTPEVARENAAAVIARIKKGQPPVPPEPAPVPTVADLAERYQREYVEMHCKPATVSHYRLMLRKHIVPDGVLAHQNEATLRYADETTWRVQELRGEDRSSRAWLTTLGGQTLAGFRECPHASIGEAARAPGD